MERIAGLGFRVALIRPIDARGKYPNFIFPSMTTGSPTSTMDRVFRTFEETGLVLGKHTFPAIFPEARHALREGVPPLPLGPPGRLRRPARHGQAAGRR